MEKIIKWGILGAGRIAAKFATDLNQTPNCQLVGVASTSLQRAENFAENFDVLHAFGAYEDLFTLQLDAVYIATPHTHHKTHTLLCLENGVGVLCEKPFAMHEGEVHEMIEKAREKHVFLMEAMWTRFLPTTLKAMELIEHGAIGEIRTLQADFGFLAKFDKEGRAFNPKLGGGAFLDIGIYPAFLSLLLLGFPSHIKASSVFASTGVDLTTSFIYQYDNRCIASLNCTFGAETNCDAIIYGDRGKIIIERRFHEATKIVLVLNDNSKEEFRFERNTFGYNYEIEEVNDCLRKNKLESDRMPLSLSLKLIHLLDKTREAANIVYK
jgi:predicted dehydrogenase